jgi:D-alanyl-D-alanine carboxypeptidase (penicillin-binding protein 5/6)
MQKLARRLVLAFGIAVSLAFSGVAPTVAQAQVLRVNTSEPRYAAIVMDANTGEVLYEVRADSPRYPASISKVMTMYLAFEALAEGRLKLTDELVVSPHAASMQPTKLGLRPGGRITVDSAMRAIATKSANDMAVALAERLGGTESNFAKLMTMRARELGMTNTQFVNASGLPNPGQISTAHDLAVLSRAVMRDFPQYYSYFSLRSFTYRGETMRNHNHLLGAVPGVDGIKTGYIGASGFNIAVSAVRDGHRLIAVVLGGNSAAARDDNVEDLLNSSFSAIKRRGMGERVTIAQNMYAPELSGPIQRPPSEQGDGDQDGLSIQLTNNPAAGQRYVIQPKMPSGSMQTVRVPAAKKGDYSAQVGAFRNRSQAQQYLATVSRRFASALSSGDGQVADRENGYYRVLFSGMSQSDAQAACRALRSKAQACLVTSD